MPRKIDILKKLSDEKNQFILDQLEKLEKMIGKAEFALYESMVEEFLQQLDTIDGNLDNDQANVKKVALIEQAWKKFQEGQGFRVINAFVHDLQEVIKLGKGYYVELIPNQVKGEEIEKILNQRLGLKWEGKTWTPITNGYVDSLLKDKSIVQDLKKIAFNNIIPAKGYKDLLTNFETYIKGKGEDPGKVS